MDIRTLPCESDERSFDEWTLQLRRDLPVFWDELLRDDGDLVPGTPTMECAVVKAVC